MEVHVAHVHDISYPWRAFSPKKSPLWRFRMNFSSFAPSSFFVTLTCNEDRVQKCLGGKVYGHYNDFKSRLMMGLELKLKPVVRGNKSWQRHAKQAMMM